MDTVASRTPYANAYAPPPPPPTPSDENKNFFKINNFKQILKAKQSITFRSQMKWTV